MELNTDNNSLFALGSVYKPSMKKPPQPLPLHPLQLARSQADLHFRPPGPRTDQVALFTAAKTLRAFSLSLPPQRNDTSFSVIFPVTWTSSGDNDARKSKLELIKSFTDSITQLNVCMQKTKIFLDATCLQSKYWQRKR